MAAVAERPTEPLRAGLAEASAELKAGRLARAEALCRQVLRSEPDQSQAIHLLGCITLHAGNPVVAAALIQKAIARDPQVAYFYNNLGQALAAQARYDDAIEAYGRALALDPDLAEASFNLGATWRERGDLDAAVASFRRAIEIDPAYVAAHRGLGSTFQEGLRYADAEGCYRRALELDPDDVHALIDLGGLLVTVGEVEAGIRHLRRAVELAPESGDACTSLLFSLHYDPTCDRDRLFVEAKAWGEAYLARLATTIPPHPNEPDPDRKLRIGYVSGDFHRHPVGFFLEAILRGHDRGQFEIYCYSAHRCIDDLTRRMRDYGGHWASLVGVRDDVAADAIRRDQIDILIDLSGHTSAHRMGIFARKPAPVQVSWIGYFDTTGLPTIDYLLADRSICPPGDERYYVEEVMRLPDGYLCYAPQSDLAVAPPPAVANGYPTFGCFNKAAKITEDVVSLWARVLRALPDARLCLKDAVYGDATVRERYQERFARRGISAERLIFQGWTPYDENLAAYARVDLALDPFPFNGGTTTVEALWMGVPVVTLAGDHFVSRMGVSHLSSVGLTELVAESPDDYVRTAIDLARDVARLGALRASLRPRMEASPLCDAGRFVRAVESRYRQMWRKWCDGRG
jgi:predicted O-linked N-acetylglucosamine transferase (SPINDLY family)